jgi:transposase
MQANRSLWGADNAWPALRRQVCWAHLKRDFQKCWERGGGGERIGTAGLKVVQRVFEEWHLFRGGGIDRATLIDRLDPVAARLHRVLEGGCAGADTKVATFCANVPSVVPALWRFVVTEGIEPTNNHAERLLRRGVLWRKNAFGCHSAEGCRFVERILTVVQTLRLRQRSVLGYLYEAIVAHRSGSPAPKLL